MLGKKLKLNTRRSQVNAGISYPIQTQKRKHHETSQHFSKPFWELFYDIECSLNDELAAIRLDSKVVETIYNPIQYASEVHCAYLRKYLTGPKRVLFIGLNGGANGMCQTGVPFGNITSVRDLMKLEGKIGQPAAVHPKRLITGFDCKTEEPSGFRFWNLLNELSTSLDIFSQQCFTTNFCPITLFDSYGHNITPSELKGNDKKIIRDTCLKYLLEEIKLIRPNIIIAVGNYVNECMKQFQKTSPIISSEITFYQIPHPSPRSINNTNWPEKGRKFFIDNDLIKFLKNEV